MFEAVDGLVAEHAELEQRLADPEIHADQRPGQAAQPAVRRAVRDRRAPSDEWQRLGDDIEAARELAAEDPSFADEAERARRAPGGRRGAAAPPAGAPRRRRRQGRAARDQVRRGRRGVGAVRRRPAADVHPVRRAARLEDRGRSTPPSPTSAATSRSPSR